MTLPPDDERTVLVSSKPAPAPDPARPVPVTGHGAAGTTGTIGSTGITGTTGTIGSTGSTGTIGTVGATGGADDVPHNALAVGTRLGEFEITGLLGEGGFGIVYLAYDSSLERHVALKEYMPSAFASRTMMSEVRVKSERHLETFQAGLRSFVNEARMLAQFDHPSLIKVYRFWEANGTAYMIMPYYQGITLKQALRERTEPADEAWLKSLLAPLLDTLTLIHDQHCFHRDIAPDNIMMIDECQPVLLDFGAARRAISGMDQAFTVILKQGYAPIEQYAETPGMDQGPWTDLFALASVVHFAIDGKPPPPAVGRAMSDPYVPLAQRYAGRYSVEFLSAIDQALSVRPEHRPQSAAAMRVLLGLGHAGATMYVPPSSVRPPPPKAEPIAPPPAPAPASKKGLLLGGAAAVLLLAAGSAYFMLNRDAPAPAAGSAPVAQVQVQAPPVAVAAPAPAVTPPVTRPATPPVTTPAALPAPVAPPQGPFDPLVALQQVVDGASADRSVSAKPTQPRMRIGHDKLGFSVTAAHAGYVYVHVVGTEPDSFSLLFPNLADKNNRINAGETINLPRKNWASVIGGPAGQDRFVVIVSDVPRDFSAARPLAGKTLSSFPAARAEKAQRQYKGSTPLFAGAPVCPASGDCSPLYGASMFTIDEVAP